MIWRAAGVPRCAVCGHDAATHLGFMRAITCPRFTPKESTMPVQNEPTTIPVPTPARDELRAMLSADLDATMSDLAVADGDDRAAHDEVAAMMRHLLLRLDETGALEVGEDALQYVRDTLLEDGLLREHGHRAVWGAALDALD